MHGTYDEGWNDAKEVYDETESIADLQRQLAEAQSALAAKDREDGGPQCAYCHRRFPNAEWGDLERHTRECEKHPLHRALIELAEAQADSAQQAKIIGRLGQQVDSLRAVVAKVKAIVSASMECNEGQRYLSDDQTYRISNILAYQPKVLAVVDGYTTTKADGNALDEFTYTELRDHDYPDEPCTAIIIERSGE